METGVTLFKLLSLWTKFDGVAIQMKHLRQYMQSIVSFSLLMLQSINQSIIYFDMLHFVHPGARKLVQNTNV